MDKERNSLGRLGYSEFKDLIVSLKLWQGVFRTHTKEKTGVLRAESAEVGDSEIHVE